jgi:hypothetical protein
MLTLSLSVEGCSSSAAGPLERSIQAGGGGGGRGRGGGGGGAAGGRGRGPGRGRGSESYLGEFSETRKYAGGDADIRTAAAAGRVLNPKP